MRLIDLLVPRIKLTHLPLILKMAVFGAVIAGTYGILHDEITYSLSPEYFTKFKFLQFNHTDFGYPVRIHVAEIGFLATWWVGFVAGWLLARYGCPHFSNELVIKYVLHGFGMIIGCAFLFGLLGFLLGYYWLRGPHLISWENFQIAHGIDDLRSFALVGYIHNSGYLGALFGLVAAIIYLRRKRPS